MITDNIKDLEARIGIDNNEILINKFLKLLETDITNEYRSIILCKIGEIYRYFYPEGSEDMGYKYFKLALNYNKLNYEARIGICSIYELYPDPPNNLVTYIEYLEQLDILLTKLKKETTNEIDLNILDSINVFLNKQRRSI